MVHRSERRKASQPNGFDQHCYQYSGTMLLQGLPSLQSTLDLSAPRESRPVTFIHRSRCC